MSTDVREKLYQYRICTICSRHWLSAILLPDLTYVQEHLAEIFGMYGVIKSCDLPPERFYSHLHRGYGYVEYENAEDAEKVHYCLSSVLW